MNNLMKSKNIFEFVIVFLIFITVNLASQYLQAPISYNDGKGWDGVEYYNVAEQFSEDQLPNAGAPWVYRVGTPFLVSLFFKENLLLGFKVVNIIASLFTVCLLLFWLRLYLINWKIRTFLLFLFITSWHGPIRFVYYYPAYADPWGLVFLLAGLIGIYKFSNNPCLKMALYLGFITFTGIFFRECVFIIPIALLFAKNPFELKTDVAHIFKLIKKPPMLSFIPIVFGIFSFVIIRLMVLQNNYYFFFKAGIYFMYKELTFPTYLLAFFIAYGPVIIVLVYNWRQIVVFLSAHQFILFYFIGVAILACGASDIERYLYWGMPVVYLLIGKSIVDNFKLLKWLPLMILVLCQLISQRFFWTIPDYPNNFITPFPILTILSSKFQYLDLYSYHGRPLSEVISLSQYLLLSLLLLWWLKRREDNIKT